MFRAKGLDPDKPPTTWSAVAVAAEKLVDPSKSVFGLGFCAHQSEQSTFQWLPWLWQAGGSIDKLEQPEAAEALELLGRHGEARIDLARRDQPAAGRRHQYLPGRPPRWRSGALGLPRFRREAKFDWRVALLPVKDGRNVRASSLGGFHFAIPKGARKSTAPSRRSRPCPTRRSSGKAGTRGPARAARRHRDRRPGLAAGLRGVSRTDADRDPARPAPAMAAALAPDPDRDPGGVDRHQAGGGGAEGCGAKIAPVLARTPL